MVVCGRRCRRTATTRQRRRRRGRIDASCGDEVAHANGIARHRRGDLLRRRGERGRPCQRGNARCEGRGRRCPAEVGVAAARLGRRAAARSGEHDPAAVVRPRVTTSAASVPVTLTTPGSLAGKVTSALPLLPAAATISTPFERAYPRAEAIPSSRPLITKLKLMTRAPWSAAQMIPSVISAALPLLVGPDHLDGHDGTTGAGSDAADPVVRSGGHDAGHEGPVPVVVVRVGVLVDRVPALDERALQVGVLGVDTRVEYRDDDLRCASRHLPRRRSANLGQRPGVAPERVVGK